jgi:hypothetical protein
METAPEPTAPLEMRMRLPRADRARFQKLPLPLWLRMGTLVVGWILIVIGIAGLFLPILQGGLSLILGFALLSIASPTVHLWLRSLMGRWPRAWRRLEKLRRRMHGWLHRMHRGRAGDDDGASETDDTQSS